MTVGNSLIKLLNRPFTRSWLKQLIFMRYRQRGKGIEKVDYHEQFGAWEYRIDGISFLSSGPGWVYDRDYLYTQLRQLSGFSYVPKKDDVVVDIGAGVGEETIIFSSLVGNTGKVFAVEAHPKTFKALTYLKEANNLENVVLSNIALSDRTGTVTIEDTDNSLANSILDVASERSFTVPAETFDDFVERNTIQSVDFLKMNVEGAEQLIIKGMIRSLDKVKHLAVSCHDFRYNQGESEFFRTKKLVTTFLLNHGFRILTQQSAVSMVDDYVYGVNPAVVEK